MRDLPVYIVVTPFFPSPDFWRGAYCYDFVQALKRTGKYDVRVFVPGNCPDYEYQGVHVYRFSVRMLPSAVLPFLFAKWNQRSFLKKIKDVGIKLDDIAVCHGHTAFFGIYPLAVKRKNPKCQTLLHHHDLASYGLNLGRLRHFYPHKMINFFLLRKMHEKIDCHVFISEAARRSFLAVPDASWSYYGEYRRQMNGLHRFRGARIKSSVILHNGVDTNIFSPNTEKEKQKGFTIGCIGNFGDIKGQYTLLEAANLLKYDFPELRIRFVGSGECLEKCRQYVCCNKMELMVSFEKECDHKDLPAFYHSIDIFCLPSYFEGFGCVFTEAYACGVPFITCEGQGMDDLILPEERKLWLCPPKNPEILAERIRNYFVNRPEQHLSGPIDIDELVTAFIDNLNKIK